MLAFVLDELKTRQMFDKVVKKGTKYLPKYVYKSIDQ